MSLVVGSFQTIQKALLVHAGEQQTAMLHVQVLGSKRGKLQSRA